MPWLQDTEQQDVWHSWEVRFRDVVFLDAQNRPVAVFNLTDHNLSEEAEYDSLLGLVEELTGQREDAQDWLRNRVLEILQMLFK